MKPEKVNPGNFENVKVIYTSSDKKFSIATGIGDGGHEYQEKHKRFAIRWNGPTDEHKGFPSSNGHPMWFQLPDNINEIIRVLLENSNLIINP